MADEDAVESLCESLYLTGMRYRVSMFNENLTDCISSFSNIFAVYHGNVVALTKILK